MSSQQEKPTRNTDADEKGASVQPPDDQTREDHTESSDQDLEDVAGGARGIAIGRGIRSGSVYSEETEAE